MIEITAPATAFVFHWSAVDCSRHCSIVGQSMRRFRPSINYYVTKKTA